MRVGTEKSGVSNEGSPNTVNRFILNNRNESKHTSQVQAGETLWVKCRNNTITN